MKALTNILTRWMLMLLLLATSCTNDIAEVETPTQQGQYVTVRMNIPGMTTTASRAADGVIETITALAFDGNGLLAVKTVDAITNTNANGGYNGSFNLTVPNGTTKIHFLANLPDDVKLPAEMGGNEIDVMTSLTTGDYNNLCYWGMTTTWDDNTNPLNVTFYRNLAKISIKPSETDTEFNQFEQNQLIIAGLINPNRVGKLVPYNGSFFQGGNAPSYYTLPDYPNPLNVTPIGNEGAGYGSSLYVFEHENSNYKEYGLFVICKIGDYFYNVALTSDGVNPYQIIRNHEYIIYVSDVDDYQTDEYRSNNYSEMYDAETSTMLKTPINLVVKQVAQVSFSNTGTQTLYWNNGNPSNFQVQMTGNDVPNDKIVTLTITAQDFNVSAANGTQLIQNGNVWTYTGTLTTLTFTPTNSGEGKIIRITGEGENVNVNLAEITVNVDATLLAVTPTAATIDMDNSATSTTLRLTKPGNITNLRVTASNNNAFTINGIAINGDYYLSSLSNSNQEIDYTIALQNGFNTAGEYTITFTDANGGGQSVSATITIQNTPSLQFEYTNNVTLYMDGGDGNPTTLTVTMTVPEGSTLTNFAISAEGFTYDTPSETYEGGTTTTFTFTPKAIGEDQDITFTGSGTNLKNVNEIITVTVKDTKPEGGVIWEGENGNPKDLISDTFIITEEDYSEKTVVFEIKTLVSSGHAELQVLDKYQTNFINFSSNDSTLKYDTENIQSLEVKIPDDRVGLGVRGYNIKLVRVYYY